MKNLLDKIGHDITAFTSIFDSIIDLVFFMEADGNSFRYIYTNQSALKILNMNKNIVGKRIEDVVPKGQSRLLISRYQEAQSTQKPVNFIQILETENGDFIGETSLNPILTEDGQCKYVLGIVRDITERKQKEKELQETKRILERNQKRLNSLVENNGDAVYELDLEGKFIQVNQMVTQITGYQEEQLVGKSFIPLIVENCLAVTTYHFKKALNGSKEEYETCITNSKGQQIHLFVKNVPIIIDGLLVGVYGIAKDITEQKKLERLLKESEERYRKVVEYSLKGIVIHRGGTIVYANPSALKIMKEDNAIRKSIYTYLHPDFKEVSKKRLSMAKSGGELPFVEMKMNRTDGEVIYAEVASVPFIYDGNPATLTMFQDITDRKNMEIDLRQTLKNLSDFKMALDESSIVAITNQRGIIEYANDKFCEISKYAKEELLGQDHRIINSGFHSKEFFQEMWKTIGQGKTWRGEIRNRAKDGSFYWVHTTIVPFLNEKGKPYQYISIRTDITDRKKAEEARLKSEEQYRLIAENMSDLLGILDLNGRVLYASPSHEHVLGLSPEMYEGNLARDVVHPNDALKLKQFFDETITTKENVSQEFRLKRVDGSYLWFESEGTPVCDENGNILHILVVARNISERKQKEEEIQKSEERYRLIAENMSDLVCVIDKEVCFKYASPSHFTVLGYSSDEYEGKCALNWIHKDDIVGVQHQLTAIIESKESGNIEFRFRNVNGNWIWFEAKLTPIFTEDGQFIHFLVVSREITERRMYEEKLTHLAFHDTLTGLPNRRLFTDRLEQAIKEAERYKRNMAVMFMDMDRFKQINDTFGHDVGDELLKQFANRVKGCLRDCDTLARQGGDEFIVLLPEIQNEQDVLIVVQRILGSLQEKWVIGEHSFHTTSSIGIAMFPNDGMNRRDLMKHADMALYEAKEDGRNNYKTFSLIRENSLLKF